MRRTSSSPNDTSLRRSCTISSHCSRRLVIWVSWPKKASKLPTDITEDTIREICLPMGLVDVKVCAIDETWSGLKLMIRKERRRA